MTIAVLSLKKNPDSMRIVEGWDFKTLDFADQRNEKTPQHISVYGIAMEDVLKCFLLN